MARSRKAKQAIPKGQPAATSDEPHVTVSGKLTPDVGAASRTTPASTSKDKKIRGLNTGGKKAA